MSTLFGNWEPEIIILPPAIPPEPTISVMPPALVEPVTHITSQRRMATLSGDKTWANQISDVGLAYSLKDNQQFGTLALLDHSCNDKAGLIRIYPGGHMNKLIVERAELLRGKYLGGICAGIVHLGSSKVDVVELRHLNYERLYPVTNSGDIYGGILTAGGKDEAGSGIPTVLDLLGENLRCRNTLVDYTGTSSFGDYPNSDGIVLEKTIKRARFNGLDFAYGSDAGVDCKCPDARFENALFNEFRESMKFWASGQDGNVYSSNPKHAHIVMPSGGADERVIEFAAFNCPDPTKPIVEFQGAPHKLILQKGYGNWNPAAQVLCTVTNGNDGIGATIQLGDKSLIVTKPIHYLAELGLAA